MYEVLIYITMGGKGMRKVVWIVVGCRNTRVVVGSETVFILFIRHGTTSVTLVVLGRPLLRSVVVVPMDVGMEEPITSGKIPHGCTRRVEPVMSLGELGKVDSVMRRTN